MQMKIRAWNRKKRQAATTLLLFCPSFWLPWWHVVLFKKLLMCKYFFKIHEKNNVMCTCSFSALFTFQAMRRCFHFAFLFCLLLKRGRFPFFSHHTAAHVDGKMGKKWQENKRSHRNSALKGKEKYVTHSSHHIITQHIRGIVNHSCDNNNSA